MNTNRSLYRQMGVLEIIIGILIILLPLVYFFTPALITGIALLFLGIAWMFLSLRIQEDSKLFSIFVLVIGIIAVISSIALFANIVTFDPLVTFWVLFIGLLFIVFGLLTFITGQKINTKWVIMAILSVFLGVISIIIGFFAVDPYYLAVLIGLFLIADGSSILFIKPARFIEPIP